MAEIVNLRSARKAKRRVEREREADANRIRFGRSRKDRAVSDSVREAEAKRLDGHRLAPQGE